MLRVNVGMSRKLTRDYQSTGFSVNLESELCADIGDPETVVEKIREVYDLADAALRDQIERYESDSAIASRDEEPNSRPIEPEVDLRQTPSHTGNGNSNANGQRSEPTSLVPATNKQIQFLLNLSKRQGLTKPQLENRIAGILGQPVDIYSLSKQQAGQVLDNLSGNGSQRSRNN